MNVTWTPQARRMRDEMMAGDMDYGFRIGRWAQQLAEFRAAEDGLNEAKVTADDMLAARLVASEDFLPKGE